MTVRLSHTHRKRIPALVGGADREGRSAGSLPRRDRTGYLRAAAGAPGPPRASAAGAARRHMGGAGHRRTSPFRFPHYRPSRLEAKPKRRAAVPETRMRRGGDGHRRAAVLPPGLTDPCPRSRGCGDPRSAHRLLSRPGQPGFLLK